MTDEDRLHLDWMADRMHDAAKDANHWNETAIEAQMKAERSAKDAAGWKERILSVDPTYFDLDLGRLELDGFDDGEKPTGTKTVPYGYWSKMAEALLAKYIMGTFDDLRDKGIAANMVDGKTAKELEPLRFALHGLARRKKIAVHNGMFSRRERVRAVVH